MLVSEFISKVNYALRGTDDSAPNSGTADWTYWVDTLNRKKNELFEDVAKDWAAAFKQTAPNEVGTVATAGTTALTGTNTFFTDYQVGDKITVDGETERTIATITSDTALTVTVAFSNTDSGLTFTHKIIIKTGVETYNLNRTFIAPSDRVYVLDTSSNRHYIDFLKAPERSTLTRNVFIAGLTPQTINFTDEDIASTDITVGGELVVPGYYMPADVSANTDTVPLPDPYWGVAAVAADIAFGDITYEDKAETLNNRANYLYSLMTKNNRRGTYGNPRRTPYNVRRIRDTRR